MEDKFIFIIIILLVILLGVTLYRVSSLKNTVEYYMKINDNLYEEKYELYKEYYKLKECKGNFTQEELLEGIDGVSSINLGVTRYVTLLKAEEELKNTLEKLKEVTEDVN